MQEDKAGYKQLSKEDWFRMLNIPVDSEGDPIDITVHSTGRIAPAPEKGESLLMTSIGLLAILCILCLAFAISATVVFGMVKWVQMLVKWCL